MTAIKLTKSDAYPGEVYENLYIGSIGAAYNKKILDEIGITHIMTVAAKIKPRFEKDFTYKIFNALDTPTCKISKYFEDSNKYIQQVLDEDPKNKILIHCFAGKSRAATFTLAYMISVKGMSLKDALEHIWTVRPICAPNPGFMEQLKSLEK